MASKVVKSFRLPVWVVDSLREWSKKEDVSQGKMFEKLVKSYEIQQMQKQMEQDILASSSDKEYMKEQVQMSQEDYI